MCGCGGTGCSACRRRERTNRAVDAVLDATQAYPKTDLEVAERTLAHSRRILEQAQEQVDRAQAKVDEIASRPEDNFEEGTVLLIHHPRALTSFRVKRFGRWEGSGGVPVQTGWEQIAHWITSPDHTVVSVETTAEIYMP